MMSDKKTFTSQEAAVIIGVSDSRVRQLALAGEIEHSYFGKSLVITEEGIKQAKARKKTPGPTKQRRKSAV